MMRTAATTPIRNYFNCNGNLFTGRRPDTVDVSGEEFQVFPSTYGSSIPIRALTVSNDSNGGIFTIAGTSFSGSFDVSGLNGLSPINFNGMEGPPTWISSDRLVDIPCYVYSSTNPMPSTLAKLQQVMRVSEKKRKQPITEKRTITRQEEDLYRDAVQALEKWSKVDFGCGLAGLNLA